MTTRRNVLKLLFGGSVVTLIGWELFAGESRVNESKSSTLGRVHRLVEEERTTPDFRPKYDFDYGERHFENVPGTRIERIDAESVDGVGDRIRIVPDAESAEKLRFWLRVTWGIDDERELTGTIRDERRRFRGGNAEGYVYFLSLPPATASPIWVLRAKTTEGARGLLD